MDVIDWLCRSSSTIDYSRL